MNRATKETRTLAKRLMTYEAPEERSSPTTKSLFFPVSAKLHPYLATLMGRGGFNALHSRALALATTEVRWLSDVHVNADGLLEGLEQAQETLHPDEILEGRIVLLAHLLGLLRAFIGELLTLRLLREVWPKMPLNDLDFGNGGNHE
jgi:hypothetical protein